MQGTALGIVEARDRPRDPEEGDHNQCGEGEGGRLDTGEIATPPRSMERGDHGDDDEREHSLAHGKVGNVVEWGEWWCDTCHTGSARVDEWCCRSVGVEPDPVDTSDPLEHRVVILRSRNARSPRAVDPGAEEVAGITPREEPEPITRDRKAER